MIIWAFYLVLHLKAHTLMARPITNSKIEPLANIYLIRKHKMMCKFSFTRLHFLCPSAILVGNVYSNDDNINSFAQVLKGQFSIKGFSI